MMTYLENDVLPFPHIKRIDLGPAMKRKVAFFLLKKILFELGFCYDQNFTEEKIFHYANEFFVSLNLTQVPDSFWNLSIFKKIPDLHMACHPTAFDMYKYDDVRFVLSDN